MKSVIKRT